MAQRIRAHLGWHLETAARLLRATSFWVPLIPAAGFLAVYELDQIPSVSPFLTKAWAETFSPLVLAVGVALAGWLVVRRGRTYDKWLLAFALALFLRELHFAGTNTAFYIALVVLIAWASYARERLEPFIYDRRIVAITMAMFCTYAVTKVLDRGYVNQLLPAGASRHLFEENLELLGHLLFVTLVIVSRHVPERATAPAAVDHIQVAGE